MAMMAMMAIMAIIRPWPPPPPAATPEDKVDAFLAGAAPCSMFVVLTLDGPQGGGRTGRGAAAIHAARRCGGG